MKNIYLLLPALLILAALSCDDDSEKKYKGVISVTVNTSPELFGYPLIDDNGPHTLAGTSGEPEDGTWMYREVGGVGPTCGEDDDGEEDLADTLIGTRDMGDRINLVYLYSTLGEKSTTTPVLYRGSSETNDSVITITNIAPGEYYVVAFYDYNSGGNRENLLNRYDRYSFYDMENDDVGTPFANEADVITVNEDFHGITLAINEDWAMGRPKYIADSGRGRTFMNSDPEYAGAGNTSVPVREVICP